MVASHSVVFAEIVEFMLPGRNAYMTVLHIEQKHESVWASMVSTITGDHLTRRQKATRSLLLLITFVLMALPCVIDLLLN